MNKRIFFSMILLSFLFTSCEKNTADEKGQVNFGANFHTINCITSVTIFVDGKGIGKIAGFTNEIAQCNAPENLTIQLGEGTHSYIAKIRPDLGVGCTKDISGTFDL